MALVISLKPSSFAAAAFFEKLGTKKLKASSSYSFSSRRIRRQSTQAFFNPLEDPIVKEGLKVSKNSDDFSVKFHGILQPEAEHAYEKLFGSMESCEAFLVTGAERDFTCGGLTIRTNVAAPLALAENATAAVAAMRLKETDLTEWHVDSGATNLVVKTSSSLYNFHVHKGKDPNMVRNDNCLPVTHSGDGILNDISVVPLKVVLVVPAIKRNLTAGHSILANGKCDDGMCLLPTTGSGFHFSSPKEPVAFLGGVFAGLLRLDLNEDPLKEWVTKTVEAAGLTEDEAIQNRIEPVDDTPQEIQIE